MRSAIQSTRSVVSMLQRTSPAVPVMTRALHVSANALSKENPGPVETKLRAEAAASKLPAGMDTSTLAPHAAGAKVYSAKIKRLAEEIANLTMLESMDLSDALREKLRLAKTDLLFPGGGMPMGGGGGGAAAAGGAAGAPAAGAAKPAAAPAAPPKEEKTHVDIKLKAFDQKNKIKVIKEIRGVTNLGLKEAKDLVEGAPCTILQKVKREDAAKMIEKLKAETGAEFELI